METRENEREPGAAVCGGKGELLCVSVHAHMLRQRRGLKGLTGSCLRFFTGIQRMQDMLFGEGGVICSGKNVETEEGCTVLEGRPPAMCNTADADPPRLASLTGVSVVG